MKFMSVERINTIGETATTIKGGNAWIKFDYDANKVFEYISKKYGR